MLLGIYLLEEITDDVATLDRSQPSGAQNQATALRAEGVTVTAGALGELMVNFDRFGWFPRRLPSEVAEGLDESDSEETEDDEKT